MTALLELLSQTLLPLALAVSVPLVAFLCALWGHWLYVRHQERKRAERNLRAAWDLLQSRRVETDAFARRKRA